MWNPRGVQSGTMIRQIGPTSQHLVMETCGPHSVTVCSRMTQWVSCREEEQVQLLVG
jgi:hypothetical protein